MPNTLNQNTSPIISFNNTTDSSSGWNIIADSIQAIEPIQWESNNFSKVAKKKPKVNLISTKMYAIVYSPQYGTGKIVEYNGPDTFESSSSGFFLAKFEQHPTPLTILANQTYGNLPFTCDRNPYSAAKKAYLESYNEYAEGDWI